MSILDGAADVLRLIIELQRSVTMSDVVHELGIPKSTASRMLKLLDEHGFLARDSASLAYGPGALLFEVAHVFQKSSLADHLEGTLRRLCEKTGDSAYISMLDGLDVLVLRSFQGPGALRVVQQSGTRSPAYATSTGRMLLSRLDDATLRRMYHGASFEVGGNAPTSFAELMSRVETARKVGWASAIDEAVPGGASVACAIESASTRECLAFCLSSPSSLATRENMAERAAMLVPQARRIGCFVGDHIWLDDMRSGKSAARPTARREGADGPSPLTTHRG
jgi:IclR family transcriptional regulator, KDG regulon repressor